MVNQGRRGQIRGRIFLEDWKARVAEEAIVARRDVRLERIFIAVESCLLSQKYVAGLQLMQYRCCRFLHIRLQFKAASGWYELRETMDVALVHRS